MSILTRKYPFQRDGNWIKDCLIYCVIVFLILYLLQPFGLSMYPCNKLLVSLLFGGVTFVCCMIYGYLVAMPVKKCVQTWRIWHETVNIFLMVLFIGLCNFLLFTFMFLDKTTDKQTGIQVTIHDTRVRGNDVTLPINDLLYIEAQKNNVVVGYVKDGKLRKDELQTSLTAVLNDLSEYDNIFQCHRSFVVNLNNITKAYGNSNGYTMELGGGLATVPVSRSFVGKLKSFIS